MSGPSYEIVPEKYNVEVDTIDKLALEEVEATKTDFFVPTYDESATWDRTKIFFVKYLGIPNLKNSLRKVGNVTVLTNDISSKSKYTYEVKKELFGNGYNYFVKCIPASGDATQKKAKRNAKNLARFILQGTLETTLLK